MTEPQPEPAPAAGPSPAGSPATDAQLAFARVATALTVVSVELEVGRLRVGGLLSEPGR